MERKSQGWKRLFGGFSFRSGDQGGAMTSFQALPTAIAAQVGTDNTVGACGAIIVGGPGAIFRMRIIALLGITNAKHDKKALDAHEEKLEDRARAESIRKAK